MQGEDSSENLPIEVVQAALAKADPSARRRIFEKFFLAALGSVPWVGGFLSAAASIRSDEAAVKHDRMQTQWLQEHQKKLDQLRETLAEVEARFETLGTTIDKRIQSEGYLALVRKAFRAWDEADTAEKQNYVGNIVANAAGTRLVADDVVRLFIDWLEQYHEAHFAVIREIFKNPGVTRYDIWNNIYGEPPRDDSAEADLFKLLIRDLNTGGVIRQSRETDPQGRFIRKRPAARRGPAPTTMESAFEDTKPYVLTELGKQFVQYTMTEVVPRIAASAPESR